MFVLAGSLLPLLTPIEWSGSVGRTDGIADWQPRVDELKSDFGQSYSTNIHPCRVQLTDGTLRMKNDTILTTASAMLVEIWPGMRVKFSSKWARMGSEYQSRCGHQKRLVAVLPTFWS